MTPNRQKNIMLKIFYSLQNIQSLELKKNHSIYVCIPLCNFVKTLIYFLIILVIQIVIKYIIAINKLYKKNV